MEHKMRSITKKIDSVTHMSPASYNVVVGPPKSAKIELTRKCNYHCSFCMNSKLEGEKGDMPIKKYISYIEKIYEAGVEELGLFYFGESFLVKWLPEAVKLAKETGFKYVFLTTNGSASTPERIRLCMKEGLNSLKFSLNAGNPMQFAQITGADPKMFHKVLHNIKKARDIRDEGDYNCGLYASYIRFNDKQDHEMENVIRMIKPYLDEVYALPIYNQAGNIDHPEWGFIGGNTGRFENQVPPVPCWALFQEAHINWNGTMNACCFATSDDFIHGDLNTDDFMDAWNSFRMQQLREAHLTKKLVGTPCEFCVKSI